MIKLKKKSILKMIESKKKRVVIKIIKIKLDIKIK
jgi:hypothetical protein